MRSIHSFAAALLGTCLMIATAGPVFAQTGMAPDESPDASQPPAASGDQDQSYSVLMITGVEMIHSGNGDPVDIIRVRGLTSTDGWTDPELLPLTQGVPEDGILNLVFVAHAPSDSSEPTGFSPIEVVFPIGSDHPPYKGIRVFGATNSVTLKALPGYAAASPALKDCGTCVGKYFVAKGATAPSGAKADAVVNESDLPSILRVIKPSDGISITDTDPNRLTIIIGDDGKIVDAAWQ